MLHRRADRSVFWACLLAAFFATPARAQLTQTFSATELATTIERALAGTSIHLHSLGPFAAGTYHLANASSIKLPAALSGAPGRRTYFTLPDISTTWLGRRYGYYVEHVRSNGLFVSAGPAQFNITITLASTGSALVGTCVRLKPPASPCANFSERLLRAIDWRDARIDIVARPIVAGHSLSLEVETVVIGGEFDVGKTCEWPVIGRPLCALLNRQGRRLRDKIAEEVRADLNAPAVRTAVSAAVRQYIDTTLGAPLIGVRGVAMQDGQVVITASLGR